ncbi:helix-turn-helix domain-containing protein [Pelotalea chapellei]|uniref:helix-turn-helix domain-containing protein n=1 Tax=Pelotalea chapellei TaxID=44671 RepID=UPI001FEA0B85|nr:helix-turn-helix domain-containing protein [Pelotalea chapellei]
MRKQRLNLVFFLHAFVLMTNHYHLVIETPDANLGKIMHYLNSSYTTYINIKRKRSGHLFQGRYKAILVDKDSYLLELSRYLHLNPVRANMVERPEEYSHSSYCSYISNSKDKIVVTALLLEMLSADTKAAKERYKTYVESVQGEELTSPLEEVYGGIMIGNEYFIRSVLSRLADNQLERTEVSHRKGLRTNIGTEEIIAAVCNHYGVALAEIAGARRSQPRNMLIYLLKKQSGATNAEIGEKFGGISYSAVAKISKNFSKQLIRDKALQREIKKIQQQYSIFKG